jgi:hypothetical protein
LRSLFGASWERRVRLSDLLPTMLLAVLSARVVAQK